MFKHIRALACARFISAGYCLFDKVSFYWEKKRKKKKERKKRDLRIYLMYVSFCLFTCETYPLFVLFSSFSLLSSSRPAHHCVFLLASYCLIVKILLWCGIPVFNFWNMQSSKANSEYYFRVNISLVLMVIRNPLSSLRSSHLDIDQQEVYL